MSAPVLRQNERMQKQCINIAHPESARPCRLPGTGTSLQQGVGAACSLVDTRVPVWLFWVPVAALHHVQPAHLIATGPRPAFLHAPADLLAHRIATTGPSSGISRISQPLGTCWLSSGSLPHTCAISNSLRPNSQSSRLVSTLARYLVGESGLRHLHSTQTRHGQCAKM